MTQRSKRASQSPPPPPPDQEFASLKDLVAVLQDSPAEVRQRMLDYLASKFSFKLSNGLAIQRFPDGEGFYILREFNGVPTSIPVRQEQIQTQHDLFQALDLAETYLEDGAPHSALRVIQTALSKHKGRNRERVPA